MIIYTCPECGHDLIDYSLTSDPPISKKECLNCGWNKIIESKEIIRIPFGGNGSNMRNATPEEQKSIQKHIEEISQPTGINFWEICTPVLPAETVYNTVPKDCENCSNHPKNGGSGICNCTLGLPEIRC